MTKRINKIGMALIGLSLIVTPVWAADYSSMTNEEMSGLRGTMRSESQEEHTAFQQEWQSRTQNMTPEERQQYMGKSANGPQDGSGNQYGKNNKNKKDQSANGPKDGSGNQYGKNNKNKKGQSANGPKDGSGNQYGKNKKNNTNYTNRSGFGYAEDSGMGGQGGYGGGQGGGGQGGRGQGGRGGRK